MARSAQYCSEWLLWLSLYRQSCLPLEMGEPDDELLRGVLVKLFADIQVEVDAAVIDYLVLRMERSLNCASQLVATLDDLSMAQKRAITKPLAAEALRRLGLQE